MPNPLTIRAGELRHQITIMQPSTTLNAVGEASQTWSPLLTTMASIRAMKQSEKDNLQELASQSVYVVTLRYPGSNYRIVSGQRVQFQQHTYTVQNVTNVLERNRVVQLTCIEIDGTL